MKKPSAAAIRAAEPLSTTGARAIPAGQPFGCSICGRPTDSPTLWRESDERDQPIEGEQALVFIGRDHAACMKRMEAHPRLYVEERGDPGHFPRLCGDCPFRRSLGCSHPDLKANGGGGLKVMLANMLRGAIVCTKGGRIREVNHALECVGKEVAP